MSAAIINFQLVDNEDFTSPLINVHNSDGTPHDLTGAALRFQVRRCNGALGSPLLDLSIGHGVTVIGSPAGGVFRLFVPRFEVEAGQHKQDLIEEYGGLRMQLFYGDFVVYHGVSRWT